MQNFLNSAPLLTRDEITAAAQQPSVVLRPNATTLLPAPALSSPMRPPSGMQPAGLIGELAVVVISAATGPVDEPGILIDADRASSAEEMAAGGHILTNADRAGASSADAAAAAENIFPFARRNLLSDASLTDSSATVTVTNANAEAANTGTVTINAPMADTVSAKWKHPIPSIHPYSSCKLP